MMSVGKGNFDVKMSGKLRFLAITLLCVTLLLQSVKSEDEFGEEIDVGDIPIPDDIESTDEAIKENVETDGEAEEEEEEIDESKLDGFEVDNGVVVLHDGDFMDFVVENSKEAPVLVEFYAPWCGHCKNLAPEYERAAKRLKALKNPVYLAKVDATEEKEIASKHDVSGYPTLKWFRDGQAYDYDGPRDEDGIVDYMTKRASPDWKPPPIAVVTLTADNFTEFINSNDLSLVEFYAPWCGHCKKLAPGYEKAAQKLKDSDEPVPLAKVDATAESSVAEEYDIQGYPTLKVFRRGKVYDYEGENNEQSIVSYMNSQKGDPSKETTLKQVEKSIQGDDVFVVGFFNEDSFPFQTYMEAAHEFRFEFKHFHTFDASVRDHFKVNVNSVVLFYPERYFTKYESKRHVIELTDESTAAEVIAFLKENNLPMVGAYSSKVEKRYSNRPLVLVFYTVDFSFDGIKNTQIWRNKVAAIANEYKDKFTFAVADETANSDLWKAFGFDDSGEDINIGILGDAERKFPMEPEDFDADEIKDFLKSFLDGKAKARIKSQPVPKKAKGPVKVVVGNSFEKIVLDPKKDVLIELYAPWCGHCKKLEPVYKELAKKLKGEKNLVIAKMDATANDAPPEYSASGFPTIYLASVDNKATPIKYDGKREIEDFITFLEENNAISKAAAKEEL